MRIALNIIIASVCMLTVYPLVSVLGVVILILINYKTN